VTQIDPSTNRALHCSRSQSRKHIHKLQATYPSIELECSHISYRISASPSSLSSASTSTSARPSRRTRRSRLSGVRSRSHGYRELPLEPRRLGQVRRRRGEGHGLNFVPHAHLHPLTGETMPLSPDLGTRELSPKSERAWMRENSVSPGRLWWNSSCHAWNANCVGTAGRTNVRRLASPG